MDPPCDTSARHFTATPGTTLLAGPCRISKARAEGRCKRKIRTDSSPTDTKDASPLRGTSNSRRSESQSIGDAETRTVFFWSQQKSDRGVGKSRMRPKRLFGLQRRPSLERTTSPSSALSPLLLVRHIFGNGMHCPYIIVRTVVKLT